MVPIPVRLGGAVIDVIAVPGKTSFAIAVIVLPFIVEGISSIVYGDAMVPV